MSNRSPHRRRAEQLAKAAADYQAAEVIPHCARCAKPCCRLDPLVLELDWRQLKTLWQLKMSRAAFDRLLASGKGPVEIRAMDGLYFAHRKVCPAYDAGAGTCRVYDQDIKPVGCSDFPVYEDRGSLIADLRCEAVNLDVLVPWIARRVGPTCRVTQVADNEFPFLITLSVKKVSV